MAKTPPDRTRTGTVAGYAGGSAMNTKPKRIQRRRTKGWRMPEGAIYVGRPTKWGNLWVVGLADCGCRCAGECTHNTFRCETAAEAVQMHRDWILSGKRSEEHTS